MSYQDRCIICPWLQITIWPEYIPYDCFIPSSLHCTIKAQFAYNPTGLMTQSHIKEEQAAIVWIDQQTHSKNITVDCYLLYDMLCAANLTSLDVLFIDVQGGDLGILHTIPWHLVDIKVSNNEHFVFANKSGEHHLTLPIIFSSLPIGHPS